MSEFWPFQSTAGAIFDSGDLQSNGLRVAQKKNFEKIFFGNFQKTSKFSQKYVLGILRPRSRLEIDFLEKIFEKVTISCNLPPA